MNGKRWICLGLVVMMLLAGASCGEQSASETADITQNTTQNTTQNITAQAATAVPGALEKPAYVEPGENGSRSDKPLGFQFELPQIGEEIAVLTVKDYGDIRIRLFPEEAPIAVANFKSLINAGYYDGLTFHRVIADFMIQGGDPNGNGTGGQSAWGEDFEDEYNTNLLHFRGALGMARTSAQNTNSSQFFINTAEPDVQKSRSWLSANGMDNSVITDEMIAMFAQYGGTYNLNGALTASKTGYTVFGQVFEGMDVVDQIRSVEVTYNDDGSEKSKLTTELVIEKAQIVTYEG